MYSLRSFEQIEDAAEWCAFCRQGRLGPPSSAKSDVTHHAIDSLNTPGKTINMKACITASRSSHYLLLAPISVLSLTNIGRKARSHGSTLPWKVIDGVKVTHLTAGEVEHVGLFRTK